MTRTYAELSSREFLRVLQVTDPKEIPAFYEVFGWGWTTHEPVSVNSKDCLLRMQSSVRWRKIYHNAVSKQEIRALEGRCDKELTSALKILNPRVYR
jgi:hypothetical protein